MKIKVGNKIKFKEEKQRYTVQACDNRFVICTKPMNALHTVLYTIIDFERNERGTDNLVFSHGYETRKDCKRNLKMLQENEMEVSYKRCIPLDIEKIYEKKTSKKHKKIYSKTEKSNSKKVLL